MKKVYCDSDVFLGLFNNEQDKVEKCRGLIENSKKGDIIIITSAITLTEVIKMKGKTSLPPSSEQIIKGFFEQEFIRIVGLDRRTAEHARHLIWKYSKLKPKDSIHIATALKTKNVEALYTFDTDLIGLSNQIGTPPLIISNPDLPDQLTLPLDS